ncbi:hypothetical protein MJO28_004911 [Puccinia striiformis f. sp. tritici]|uniref:Uncharacterized protein n=1 Tax=Puccinia striiformis f. sp. tritici TaxID=168172 RepID=A0ACC0EIT8_9BASI|nr:hypothetical protein MJO28_004911 [Puccinia striiformis f. sp. tritici]KAI7959926.1 hypothetical protein MJO29_004994 [Puccinia striiformis f. sp. tritici]
MTTRSTKMIPMGAGNNPTATASPNQSTPTKRKRSQPELPTVNPAPTSWLGIAFQIPSVIRKEINDFVKAVRGGGSSSSSSSSICNSTLTVPLAGKTDNNNPKTASTRTRRYTIKRHSRSVTATEPRRRPGSPRRITKTFEGDHPPRLPSPHFSELDLPSPSKKFRLADNNSNMTLNEDSGNQARNDQITNLQQQQQQRLMSLDQPMTLQAQQELNHSSPPSTRKLPFPAVPTIIIIIIIIAVHCASERNVGRPTLGFIPSMSATAHPKVSFPSGILFQLSSLARFLSSSNIP